MPKCFPEWLYHLTAPSAVKKRARCSDLCRPLILSVFGLSHFSKYISLWFQFAFPQRLVMLNSFFMCLFAIWILPLVKRLLKSFVHFPNGMFIFLLLYLEFLIYYGYKFFIGYMICKYFLPICGLSFYLLKWVFCRTNDFFFIFMKPSLFLLWIAPLVLCQSFPKWLYRRKKKSTIVSSSHVFNTVRDAERYIDIEELCSRSF